MPINLQNKCKWLSEMDKKKQSLIFGLEGEKLKMALDRKYTIPFIFDGIKSEKNELFKIVKKKLMLQMLIAIELIYLSYKLFID